MEREKGFEPSTFCLEGRRSTPELLPHKSLYQLNMASYHCLEILRYQNARLTLGADDERNTNYSWRYR